MPAFKKELLEEIEQLHGLEPGDLSYQQRCKRAAMAQKGELNAYTPPTPKPLTAKDSKIYGKKVLITPLIKPNKDQAFYYEEVLSKDTIEVEELDAGELLYGANENLDRMVSDYKITNVRKDHPVIAKSGIPKIGQELSYTIGKDLVPVSRGNDGSRGYIWSFPTRTFPVEDETGEVTMITLYGLKTLIQGIYPELLDKFSGKPVMSYQDGYQLVASIPQTHAILKQHRQKMLAAKAAGLGLEADAIARGW